MQFEFTPEHEELRRALRRFCATEASDEAVRRDMDSERGWNPGTWRRLTAELGITALAVPEEYGGSGFGAIELGVVFREAGRSLLCAPLLATSIATRVLLESGDEKAAAEHLPEVASGAITAALAAVEARDADGDTTAEAGSGGWFLSGRKTWVLDGTTADLLIVSARTAEGTSLFSVDPATPAVTRTALTTVDPTRRAADVRFDRAPAVLLGTAGDADAVLRRSLDVAVVLLAAEQVGLAERCLETATAYALDRRQFGRPIGSFQAVKHKLASVLLEVEAATSAMMYGLWVADRRPEDLPEAAAIAGSTCGDTALLAAGENIQVHGGIGITWEHSAHLYLKRATVDRQLFGDPRSHLERLADRVLPRVAGA